MTKYLAVRTVERTERYECRACGHSAQARVSLRTAGSAQYSTEHALRSADNAVDADVRSALGLVRCPRCRRRGTRAVLSLAIWTAVPAIFFAAIGVWFWRIGGFPRVLSVVWLASAAGVVLLARRTLARTEREVRFLDP